MSRTTKAHPIVVSKRETEELVVEFWEINRFIDSRAPNYVESMRSDESDSMNDGWNLSVCGLNCAQCDIFKAGHGDEKLRQEILHWFKETRHQDIKPENIRCESCRGPPENNWSSDCKMLHCANEKGVDYCFLCNNFPCRTLSAFAEDGTSHHKRTLENLKRMRKIGLEAWIAEQKRKGPPSFCP